MKSGTEYENEVYKHHRALYAMNLALLVSKYLTARPLNTALNIFLLGMGVAVVTLLLLINHQFQEKITSNSKGIDLVVGAKGSPMQLILCNIFHVDFPTGNINLIEAERIARHRLVKTAIPMALGDSYQGFRIVGTTHEYVSLYDGVVHEGALWNKPMEVTLGHSVAQHLKTKLGFSFESNHGLSQSGHAHDQHAFVVAGVLAPTGSVLDNLILTSVESVWAVHDLLTHTATSGDRHLPSPLVPSVAAGDSTKEITSLLIRYRSAMGAIQLPRWVNGQSSLQAASPAFETARLFAIVGIGVDVLRGLALVLIVISAVSIFIALYNALKERKYDLAIMRSMGASKAKIFVSVLLEGTVMAFAGACLGILMAHATLIISSALIDEVGRSGISGWVFLPGEGIILAGSLLLGILCSLLPAVQAYRTDISKVLASA